MRTPANPVTTLTIAALCALVGLSGSAVADKDDPVHSDWVHNGPSAAGSSLAYEQVVSCTVEDGCDGKRVHTAAAVLQPLPGDAASAEVLCDDVLQVGSFADFAAPTDLDGPALKPIGQDYECRMGFQAAPGSTPYLAVSACYDEA